MPKKNSNTTNQVNRKLDLILKILVSATGKSGAGAMRPPVGMPPQRPPMGGMPQRPQGPPPAMAQRPTPLQRPPAGPAGSMPIRGR